MKITDAERWAAILHLARVRSAATRKASGWTMPMKSRYTKDKGNTGRAPDPSRVALAQRLLTCIRRTSDAEDRARLVEYFERVAPWVTYSELHDRKLMGRKLTQEEKRKTRGVWPDLFNTVKGVVDKILEG